MSLSTNLVTLIYSIKCLFLMFVSIDMMAHCKLYAGIYAYVLIVLSIGQTYIRIIIFVCSFSHRKM